MWAVFLKEGNYQYNNVIYTQGVPQLVPIKDEARISQSGVFLCADKKEDLESFKVGSGETIKAAETELPKDYTGKNILVKRLAALGDIIGTLGACQNIKNLNSDCNLVLACKKEQHSLVELFDCVDEVIDYADSKKMKQFSRFPIILDFYNVIEGNPKRSSIDYYNLYKDRLGSEFKNRNVVLPKLNKNKFISCDDFLNKNLIEKNKYIILHTGGSSNLRKWENNKWLRLALDIVENTRYKVVFTGNYLDFFYT